LFGPLRHLQQPFLDKRRSFAVEGMRVDTELLEQARAAGCSKTVLFISTEDAQLNVGRVLVRMSRGGQAVPVSSVFASYGESTKNLPEVLKRTDELIVYDNTVHRRGFRVVAQFTGAICAKSLKQYRTGLLKSLAKRCIKENNLRSLNKHADSSILWFIVGTVMLWVPISMFMNIYSTRFNRATLKKWKPRTRRTFFEWLSERDKPPQMFWQVEEAVGLY